MANPLRLKLEKIESHGALIVLITRQEKTNERYTVQVTDFAPYFYVDAAEEKDVKSKGLRYEPGFPGYPEDPREGNVPTLRVFVDEPGSVNRRRGGFKRTWEADVPYTRRFLIDTGITSGFQVNEWTDVGDHHVMASVADIEAANDVQAKDRKVLFDIETNRPEGEKKYSHQMVAAGAVTAFTLWDNYQDDLYVTAIWHPYLGNPGRRKVERRRVYSEAQGRNVDWEIYIYGTETDLLKDWVDYLKANRPDILGAWNGHYGFVKRNTGGYDVPYLINRLNRIGISAGQMSPMGTCSVGYNTKKRGGSGKGLWNCSVDGIQLIDLMSTYSVKEGGFLAVVPFSNLKQVAWKYAGYKLHKDPPAIEEWWLNDTERFLEYSFRDVDALVALEAKEGYTDWLQDLQRFAGLEDANICFRSSTLVGTMELREARRRGVCLPTSTYSGDPDDEEDEIKGGMVIDPRRTGVIPCVGVIDLNKMYVEIIQACNISYETWVPDPDTSGIAPEHIVQIPTDAGVMHFRTDIEGLTPAVLKLLKHLRDKYDAELKASTDVKETERITKRRLTIKNLILTAYGQFLSRFNRLCRLQTGRAVTGAGRTIISHVDETLMELLVQILYGDTDSAFLDLSAEGEDPVTFGEWVAEIINRSFDTVAAGFNVRQHGFHVDFEVIYKPFVMGKTKKRYAGVVVWKNGKWLPEPDLVVKGLEGIKSDAAPITSEATDAVLKAILGGSSDLDVLAYVRAMYEAVSQGQIPLPEVVRSVTLNFDPETDKSTSPALKGAQHGLKLGYLYNVGARVRVVRARGTENPWISIPEGEEIPEDTPIDWEHHANAVILSPMRGILDWVGLGDQVVAIRHGARPTRQNRLR